MPALSSLKNGGVSGAWDRLRYICLCLYTTLTTTSFARERVIQYLVRKWIRVMRQPCIVSCSLSDAFHERKHSRALSTIKLLILTFCSVSYCTVFGKASGKVSGKLGKFRNSFKRLSVYENSHHSAKRYLSVYLVGRIILLNLLCLFFQRNKVYFVFCIRGIYILAIFMLLKLWMFLITVIIVLSRSQFSGQRELFTVTSRIYCHFH